MDVLSSTGYKLFRDFIYERCGIDIPVEKSYLIETRLSKMLHDSGLSSFDELYGYIIRRNNTNLIDKLIDAITTNETSWFREKSPWDIMEKMYLPKYVEALRSRTKSKIRIWSAAASSGQEAYSTAMMIDSWLEKQNIRDISLDDFEIIATDISYTILETAKVGRYDAISIMRGLDPYYKQKYFRKDGSAWEIDDHIKNSVKFKQFNLLNSYMPLGKFDIIFFRYVLIYFSDKIKEDTIAKLFGSSLDDTVLFIGSSEIYECIDKYYRRNYLDNRVYYLPRR